MGDNSDSEHLVECLEAAATPQKSNRQFRVSRLTNSFESLACRVSVLGHHVRKSLSFLVSFKDKPQKGKKKLGKGYTASF